MLSGVIDSSRMTVISSGRSELKEAVVIYALDYQCCRFRFKSSYSLASLIIVKSAETKPEPILCP